jgi:hypothetical protein
MLKVKHMKYLILISALFLTSCANLRPGSILNPATREEILAGKIDTWTTQESAQLSEGFSKGFPLYLAKTEKFAWINEAKLAKLKSLSDEVSPKNTKAKLESYDGSMKDLREYYGGASVALDEIVTSIYFFDEAINRAGSSLENDLRPFRYGGETAYCEKLGIEVRDSYRLDCTTEVIGQALVKRQFYADNPSLESYYSWLNEAKQNLKSSKDLIFTFGLSQETKDYFAHAKKSGCGDVKGFETGLARTITYGRNPVEGYIYSLSAFKVLQSTGNGILLRSTYPDAYKSQPIFVQTNRNYADGTSFRDSPPLACFTGKMKQYSSVLGVNRKVYSLTAIPDSKESYYFLQLAE